MKVLRITILFLFMFQICHLATAQVVVFETDKIPDRIPQNLYIYLVIGQSNMAGRGAIREEDKVSVEHCYLFTGDSKTPWVIATNPLNRYSSMRKDLKMQRLSPAFEFARSISAENPDNEVGIVMNARGGTKIVEWLPGTKLYQEAIKQTHKALKYGKLKGVIWHQGEGDCLLVSVDLYLGRLEILINAIREEFDYQNMPFVAGQLFENENRHAFNEMILQLPDFIDYTGVAISEGTNTKDGTHFNSESANLMGNRYADEMKRIQFEMKNKNKKE